MQVSEYASLGFATSSATKLVDAAIASGRVRGLQRVPGFDLIGAYTDPSGARLGLVRRRGHDVVVTPALVSAQATRASVRRLNDHLAHASVLLDDDAVELIVSVDDPTQYPLAETGQFALISALTLGAICVRADVYRDEEHFLASRPDDDHPWSSRTLVSPSVAAVGLLGERELTARALVGFTVEWAERRTTELSGREFWYGVGRSVVPLAFALPAGLDVVPGNVVLGTFTLSASSGLWERA